MAELVWIIPLDRAGALGKGGVSPNYIIPQSYLDNDLASFKWKRICLVIRGQTDRCIAIIFPKKIERFSEGYHKGDVLVTVDLKRSFRLSSGWESAKAYELNFSRHLSAGIHAFEDESFNALVQLINNNLQAKLVPPNINRIAQTLVTAPRKGSTVSWALNQIIQNFSLEELWGSGVNPKLKPFANFARQLLSQKKLEMNGAYLSWLNENDPVNRLLTDVSPASDGTSEKQIRGLVDLDFTEVDPTTVYAREFVLSNQFPIDIEKALEKTEVAEKVHQDMLRDISIFLRTRNVIPFESTSVDLMIEHRGTTNVFEVKSATDQNLLAQAAKGAFQIACYLDAMSSDFAPIEGFLIMHKTQALHIEGIVANALKRMNTKLLIYDPSIDWPYRVSGFFNELN